jgi:hypothetical protein
VQNARRALPSGIQWKGKSALEMLMQLSSTSRILLTSIKGVKGFKINSDSLPGMSSFESMGKQNERFIILLDIDKVF